MALIQVSFKMDCSAEMVSLFGKTIRFIKEDSKMAKWTVKASSSSQTDKSSEEFGNKENTLS